MSGDRASEFHRYVASTNVSTNVSTNLEIRRCRRVYEINRLTYLARYIDAVTIRDATLAPRSFQL